MIFDLLFLSMSITAMFTFKKHYVFFIMLIIASVLKLPVSLAVVFHQTFNGMDLLTYLSKFIYALTLPVALMYKKRSKDSI